MTTPSLWYVQLILVAKLSVLNSDWLLKNAQVYCLLLLHRCFRASCISLCLQDEGRADTRRVYLSEFLGNNCH